jgi:putative CocE/NonD family hydrolase
MEASGAAIYGYGGWFDGAFPRELINLHMTVHTPGSKLILGPWGHHAKFNSSPVVVDKQASEFDQAAEIARFFDYHLKGIDLGISDEMPVHYYTMGEEKWKTANAWPPQKMDNLKYYLAERNSLSTEVPTAQQASDVYKVDFTAGTGIYSRFGEHLEGGRYPVIYPDRKMRDQKLLTYTSAPLEHDLEITGNPIVTLFISCSTTDGAVFVYLEDVHPDGKVTIVTDGCLRPIFHKMSDEKPPYWQAGPYRAYRKADANPLEIGKVTELTFDLFPVSYLYRVGHSIRMAISGADADNFVQIPKGEPPAVEFYRNSNFPSSVNLPVFPRN